MLIGIAADIHSFKGTPKAIVISNDDKEQFLKEVMDVTKYHDNFRHLVLGSVIFGIDVEFRDLEGLNWMILYPFFYGKY